MSKKLYVGNLSYNTSEETLRTLFAEYGEIESVSVITDRETGRPRGFAFVEMSTQAAADASIAGLNGKTIDDRQLTVNKANPRPDRDRERRPSNRNRGGW